MAKIYFEKILIEFLNSPFNRQFDEKLKSALKEQGLEYKDGEIVKTQRRVAAEAKEAIFDDENARIRNDILRILKGELGYTSKEDADKYIAWIEKQGENILIEEIKRRKELYSQEKEKAVSSTEKLSLGGRIAMLEELCAFIDVKQGERKSTNNKEKLDLLNFIRKETGCGLAEANNALLKLIKALKQHPFPIMDKPRKLKIEWEE